MRFLFCPPASHGFVFPCAGIALRLRQLGHEVAFATGHRFDSWLAGNGLRRIPRTERDGDSFHVENWVDPTRVGLQLKHLSFALKQWEPDALIGSSLALGPYI